MSVSPVRQDPAEEAARRAFDFYSVSKRTLDLLLGPVVLVLRLPVIAVIAVAIAIESRGPVFFRQERVGVRGQDVHRCGSSGR